MSRSVTVTDGVLTEEDVLRRSRAANLGSVKHLTIYGAGSEHHNRRLHSRSHPPIASAHHRVPAVRGSARRIYRVPADALRDALARWKPGGRSTPHAHIVWDARRAAVGLVTRATCTCAQVVTLAPFASCAALIELFLRSNAICDLEEVTHTTPLGLRPLVHGIVLRDALCSPAYERPRSYAGHAPAPAPAAAHPLAARQPGGEQAQLPRFCAQPVAAAQGKEYYLGSSD